MIEFAGGYGPSKLPSFLRASRVNVPCPYDGKRIVWSGVERGGSVKSPALDGVEGWGRSLCFQDLGIFLWWRGFFSAFEANQGQEISGVEWITADGLLSSGA